MIAIKEITSKIVAIANPKYDLVLVNFDNTITGHYMVENEIQSDQKLHILVDVTVRNGIKDRFGVMDFEKGKVTNYQTIEAQNVPAPIIKACNQVLLQYPKALKQNEIDPNALTI